MREWVTLAVVAVILASGWFMYRDYSAGEERARRAAEKRESDARARAEQVELQERQERAAAEAKRQADLEAQQRLAEQKREDEKRAALAQQAAMEQAAKDKALAEAQQKAEVERQQRALAEQAATEEKEREARQAATDLVQNQERARNEMITTLNNLKALAEQKKAFENKLRLLKNRQDADQQEIERTKTYIKNLRTQNGQAVVDTGGSRLAFDYSGEIATQEGRLASLKKELSTTMDALKAAGVEQLRLETDLTLAASRKTALEKRFTELGISLDPAKGAPARRYYLVTLSDGRQLAASAVTSLADQDVASIKQTDGNFLTVKKSEIVKILDPEPVLPAAAPKP